MKILQDLWPVIVAAILACGPSAATPDAGRDAWSLADAKTNDSAVTDAGTMRGSTGTIPGRCTEFRN